MESILILLIISIQSAIVYFGVKYLSLLNEKIISLNEKVLEITPKITPAFDKAKSAFHMVNTLFEKFFKHKNKIKVYRNIMILKSLVVAIILYKKRKSLFNFFSLYDIISKFTKAILEF